MNNILSKNKQLIIYSIISILTVIHFHVVFAQDNVKTMQVIFEESLDQKQTKTITIDNLKTIKNISVDTGDVTYTVAGNDVNIEVNNGEVQREEPIIETKEVELTKTTVAGGDPASFPDSLTYDENGFVGELTKVGDPVVISGTPGIPSESKDITVDVPTTWELQGYAANDKEWLTPIKITFISRNYTIDYDYEDPTGTLFTGKLTMVSFDHMTIFDMVTPDQVNDNGGSSADWIEGNAEVALPFSGKVTSNGTPDTRVWEQRYAGTISKTTSVNQYYAYTVTIEYEENTNIDEVNPNKPNIDGSEITPNNPDIPQTGDINNFFFKSIIVGASCILLFTVLKKVNSHK